ncbi:MAG TPA: tryptophan-rich sensory protein [Kiritimatiellia bacterium]|mgnify:CR=1 FL=1|nr:tryptophan-rich sensory protein [Kiritimatiellia bacterium]
MNSRSFLALTGWLLLTFSTSLTGFSVSTEGWYDTINKPSWNPPSWIFGPVWTTLYILMGTAAWRIWRQGGWAGQKSALTLYLIQLALNALWTPLFFGLQKPGWALVDIVILIILILATMRAFRPVDKWAVYLMAPYLLWVIFAAALNTALWWMN